MKGNGAFPFEMILKNEETNKEIFIDTVEEIMNIDLQEKNSFGCMIKDCHMHVGSKKHLNEFVEAELLFHNSYYNKRFALLTQMFLEKKVDNWERIVLVGYETFGELYLRETMELLRMKYPNKEIEYCVVEAKGKNRVRTSAQEDFYNNSTYIVFIVPINTTLTTHDKLIETFSRYLDNKKCTISEENSINLALIVIAPMKKNDYWTMSSEENVIQLNEEKQGLLKRLGKRKVYYFASHDSIWADASKCEQCYPDLCGKNYVDEKPIFEVNRESIVPMLQLGVRKIPEPLNPRNKEKENKNIAKMIMLSHFLYHGHIVRNGNHYQYYFDTQRYFDHLKQLDLSEFSVERWLIDEVKPKVLGENNENQDYIIFNFLVAPRHYSNAGIVQSVNDYVFNGAARVLYFDVNKEYRNNIKAKYSDFTRLVQNIMSSKQKASIRFHYVDDMIFSGSSFSRTKSLINSLVTSVTDGKEWLCNKKIFSSVILLVGRSSIETKKTYIENCDAFFEYVHLSISPMRNHEDACTLCQLEKTYKKLEDISGTNMMAESCKQTVKNHSLRDITLFDGRQYIEEDSKRLRIILRHLLAERISNNWWMNQNKDYIAVNAENADDIYGVIMRFYDNIDKELRTYESFSRKDVRVALIKVITRPFFTYHIRRKQASFRFCLELIEKLLEKSRLYELGDEEHAVVGALLNGLADMNANYLIREENIKKILLYLQRNTSYCDRLTYFKALKKVIGLSLDESKALLLEHILVEGTEKGFFGENVAIDKKEILHLDNEDWLSLYLENNNILISGFKDISNELQKHDIEEMYPYYLEKFFKVFEINGVCGREIKEYFSIYCDLDKVLARENTDLQKIANYISSLFMYRDVMVFLRDENESYSLLEKYYLLNNSKKEAQKFYNQNNLEELESFFEIVDSSAKRKLVLDTVYYNDEFCVIKINSATKESLYIKVDWFEEGNKSNEVNIISRVLFPLKVLLTLRKKTENFLTRSNISNVKQQLYMEKNRKALVIKKAANHQQTENFECRTSTRAMYNVYESMVNKLEFGNKDEIVEASKILVDAYKQVFDKYMLFLSNQFISEMYREVVYSKPEKFRIERVYLGELMENYLKSIGFKECEKGEELQYCLNIANEKKHDYNSTTGNVQVTIHCNIRKFKNMYFWFIKSGGEKVPYYYLLMLALAGNAGYHFKNHSGIGKCEFYVDVEDEYIVFSNNISNGCLDVKEYGVIQDKVNLKMQCPPWEFDKKEQSITLWTLAQYFERIKQKKDIETVHVKCNEWIKIDIKDNIFSVKLRLLEREENPIDEYK